jgi:hypothetical protein
VLLDRLQTPGDHPVDSDVICVVTRFELRRFWHLWAVRRQYGLVARAAAHAPGLLKTVFVVENLHSCFTISFWADFASIPLFGTNVPQHVRAARGIFRRLRFDPDRGPEIWSTKWRLRSVSNNLRWGSFDPHSLLGQSEQSNDARTS